PPLRSFPTRRSSDLVSGPGVVNHAVRHAPKDMPLHELAELIKKLSFKLARAGELVGREAARRLGIRFGIIDLSLAPTPAPGDSRSEEHTSELQSQSN